MMTGAWAACTKSDSDRSCNHGHDGKVRRKNRRKVLSSLYFVMWVGCLPVVMFLTGAGQRFNKSTCNC